MVNFWIFQNENLTKVLKNYKKKILETSKMRNIHQC